MLSSRLIAALLSMLCSMPSLAETIMGKEAPACVGKQVQTVHEAKCIALFYGQFVSTMHALGGERDVRAVKKENDWYIYPTKSSARIDLDTALYKIDSKTGMPSDYLPLVSSND
ncbi:hypothetical protein ACFSJ3_10860 [Corallincola platygyrae]|uniref:Uncharacterized protein n=1 Tax=Corallincola platygyrae TaxID=1193278 RepID=A0ABW4XLP5_9GAMM